STHCDGQPDPDSGRTETGVVRFTCVWTGRHEDGAHRWAPPWSPNGGRPWGSNGWVPGHVPIGSNGGVAHVPSTRRCHEASHNPLHDAPRPLLSRASSRTAAGQQPDTIGTGKIIGRVVDAASSQPIAGVAVGVQEREGLTSITDGEG